MNEYETLVLWKGEDKTKQIEFVRQEKNIYKVKFLNSKTEYPCKDVQILTLKTQFFPDSVQLIKDLKIIDGYEVALDFGNYIKIFFKNNSTPKIFKKSDLDIKYGYKGKEMKVLAYLKKCAYTNLISEKLSDQDNTVHIKKQYESLELVEIDSVLSTYLDGSDVPKRDCSCDFIYPFGSNASQIQAIHKAFQNQISIIEGPPGTGKTQTILNIIANILLRNKTVAVVSNNNSATINVQEKLIDKHYGYILAPLGCNGNVTAFINKQKQQDERKITCGPVILSKKEVESKQSEINKITDEILQLYEKENEQKKLKQYLVDYKLEFEYFKREECDFKIPEQITLSLERKDKETLFRMLIFFETLIQKNFYVIRLFLFCFVYALSFKQVKELGNHRFMVAIKHYIYQVQIKRIENKIVEIDSFLELNKIDEKKRKLQDLSITIFNHTLASKYNSMSEHTEFNEITQDNFRQIVKEYPVVTSSTHSISKTSHKYLYDFVIIDEASQVDILTGCLSLSCARNAIVVGDIKQLDCIINSKLAMDYKKIFTEFQLHQSYNYVEHSILSSLLELFPSIAKTMLKEHYRCHPKIIDFCNKKFYNNELIIMTKDNNSSDVLSVIKTVKGNHASGHKNQRQIDETTEYLKSSKLLEKYTVNDIGIITPYRNQKEAFMKDLKKIDIEIQSDTVHRFQGQEKDVIIISTVDNVIGQFVDDPKILNVGISRAKEKLIVLISDNDKNLSTNTGDLIRYIQYNNYEITQGKVKSIFDLLYKEYAATRRKKLDELKKRYKVDSKYESEMLLFSELKEILGTDKYNSLDFVEQYPLNKLIRNFSLLNPIEEKYAKNSWTTIDFLIINKFDKSAVLAIEVDGESFHKKGSKQYERDVMKDDILGKYHIPILRLNTKGSEERKKITSALDNAMKNLNSSKEL